MSDPATTATTASTLLGLAPEFWSSLAGTIVGALASLGGIYLTHRLAKSDQRKRDLARQRLLREMLSEPGNEWRKLETLSKVIGESQEETKRLLFDMGARGSETDNDVWALMSLKPLKKKTAK